MGKASIWLKVISPLTVLFACVAAYFAVQRYLPYILPENVCFSRNGIAIGDEEACKHASASIALEERAMELGLTAWTPWTKAKLFRDLVNLCKMTCAKDAQCSFYLLRVPKHGRLAQISGNCLTYR